MGRILTAFRVFFAALFSGAVATRLQQALTESELPATKIQPAAPQAIATSIPAPRPSKQNAAVTLLATLQREARLVDFIQEDLSGYSDDQVGAAVREIHRESGAVLKRLFEISPILTDAEGATVAVPAGFDAARYRLTGTLIGNAPFQGTLRHHGWEITRCEIPEFIGGDSAATTIMPAEVEVH